jgi:vitamin B12 transporter
MSFIRAFRHLVPAWLICLATPSAVAEIEEVLVTASHQPQTLSQIGSAISRIEANELADQTSTYAADLLRNAVGVSVNQSGPLGALTQVRMRGAEANHTLVMIDGMRVNDISLGSEFNFANLTNADISHVEVLRGPQSARYGSDAIGGVIGIFTRQRESVGWHGGANLGIGQFNTQDLGARIGFRSNDTQRNWHAHLNVGQLTTDGIDASPIGAELDGFNSTQVSAQAHVNFTPDASMSMVLRQVNTESEGDKQDFDFPTTATQGLIVDADERVDGEQQHLHVSFAHKIGNWAHHATLTQSQNSTDYLVNGTATSGLRGERLLLDLQTTRRITSGKAEQSINMGLQSEQRDFENIYGGFSAANYTADDSQNSLFTEYLVDYARTSLALSLRRDWNQRFANATTARGSISHVLLRSAASQGRLHLSFGQGITNPSFFELFGFIPSTFIGNPELQPERSSSYDVGWSQSWESELVGTPAQWDFDFTYFSADLQNEITTVYDANFMSQPINLETDSDRSGIEVAGNLVIGAAWQVAVAYTRLTAQENGVEEVRRPKHSGQVRLSRDFADSTGRASIQFLHNGRRTDNEFIYATAVTRVNLQPYTLTNIGISYDLRPNLTLTGRIDNLTNTQYQQVFGYNSPGRYVSVGAKLNLE